MVPRLSRSSPITKKTTDALAFAKLTAKQRLVPQASAPSTFESSDSEPPSQGRRTGDQAIDSTASSGNIRSSTKTSRAAKKPRLLAELESGLLDTAFVLTPESVDDDDDDDELKSLTIDRSGRRVRGLKRPTPDQKATRRSTRRAAQEPKIYNQRYHPQDPYLPYRRLSREPDESHDSTASETSDYQRQPEASKDEVIRAKDVENISSDSDSHSGTHRRRLVLEKAPSRDPKATRFSKRTQAQKAVNYHMNRHPMDALIGRPGLKRSRLSPASSNVEAVATDTEEASTNDRASIDLLVEVSTTADAEDERLDDENLQHSESLELGLPNSEDSEPADDLPERRSTSPKQRSQNNEGLMAPDELRDTIRSASQLLRGTRGSVDTLELLSSTEEIETSFETTTSKTASAADAINDNDTSKAGLKKPFRVPSRTSSSNTPFKPVGRSVSANQRMPSQYWSDG